MANIINMIGLIAGILSIWQFSTKGKEMTMKFGSKTPKFEAVNGFKVY